MSKIYLASPLFTEQERSYVRSYAKQFRSISGNEVYVPMEHKIEGGEDMPNIEWGRRVFEEDVHALDWCDMVIVLYYGLISDSGTAWEQGYAYAKGKQVTVINLGGENPVSLMVANGQTSDPKKTMPDAYQT